MSDNLFLNLPVMRRSLTIGLVYTVLGLAAGIFEQAFTVANNFTGSSALSTIHTHLLMLGTVMMLIVGIIISLLDIDDDHTLRSFFIVYNAGVAIAVFGQLWRGVHEVLGTDFSSLVAWYEPALSATSGIGHGLLGVGLLFFFWIAIRGVRRLSA